MRLDHWARPLERPLAAASIIIVFASAVIVPIILLVENRMDYSVLLSVETAGLDIEFREDTTRWYFPQAVLCRRLPQPRLEANAGAAGSEPSPLCPPAFFETVPPKQVSVDMPEGAVARINQTAEAVEISLLSGFASDCGNDVGCDGNILVVPVSQSRATGTLAFRGCVQMGRTAGSGERAFLHRGEYRFLRSRLFWREDAPTAILKSGELLFGQSATVYRRDDTTDPCAGPQSVGYGHLAFGLGEDVFIEALFVSEPGRHGISVGQWGEFEPTRIEPNWLDVFKSSPLQIAMLAFLGFSASLGQLVFAAYASLTGTRE